MSFHVVIPARLDSTRLPGKVLRPIAGVPMIAHVCRAALASRAASVWVATDSPDVAAAAEAAGAKTLMTGADHVCGSDRIAEAVAGTAWPPEAVVLNVQGDEPMMPPALIDQVAEALLADPEADMATAGTPIVDADEWANPNVVKVVAAGGRALYFSRASIPFHRDSANADFSRGRRHLGIYAYRVAALRRFAAAETGHLEAHESLEQLRALELGMKIAVVEATALPGPGVDTPADLLIVEERMNNQ
ncbi:3-deoxy-manno-octulosonate cytidylyltransferase [Salinisphaera sp. Q1T1-3]|uniref:3-deoxy-manno-octulosonate cytidylyltransferase n=1 Tax=Salinisphaera sp. Q1T1-3 TaxID=2321229 RepID=UPI000E71DEF2|nr:3-deoxy-manno-octulosonate cytidylyltransferase [Salinisphaera sp. Q1T1-3]RJS95372.1 3-deoxy-manno-octulosonate cytidylyltransferase [Salinisphaera sp. Q1T1-3]